MTEVMGEVDLCFPQLLNTSCRKPEPPHFNTVLIYILLSFISLLTAALNLLVIISIAHFRQIIFTALANTLICCGLIFRKKRLSHEVFTYCLLVYFVILWFVIITTFCKTTFSISYNVNMILSHCRQLHTPTNLVLLSLAVSDFLVGLLLLPAEILLTETCWILGNFLCALYYLLPIIIVSASVGNMMLISVDRYVAIVDPLHYSIKVTKRIVTICICLCWICSVFYSIILLYDNLKQPGRYNSCEGECMVNITGAVDLVMSFIIPITVIIVLYMRVFVVAVSQARAMRSSIKAVSLHLSVKVTVKKSEIKAARTLGIVIVVFLMCYSPYYCVSLTGKDILIGTTTEVFMIYLMYFNSCLNPVIYVFFYPWFKKTIRLILTLKILQPDTCDANIL